MGRLRIKTKKTFSRAGRVAALVKAARANKFQAARSSAMAASLRTGGWSNPSRTSEKKYIDTSASSFIVAAQTTAVKSLVNGCVQGSDATNRIGRRIMMKSLYINFACSMAATSAGSSPIRILVVYDSQANAAAPATTDVVQSDLIYSPNNLNNRTRFVTLLDKLIPCLSTAGPAAFHKKYFKKLNHEVVFNSGNAGTIGDIQTGSVYLFVWQNGNIITASPTNAIYVRIRFEDA